MIKQLVEIHTDIEGIQNDSSLLEEKSFDSRVEAVDFIEFNIIDHLEYLLQKGEQIAELLSLKLQAEKLKAELEEINIRLFNRLREDIRTRKYTGNGFRALINEYVDFNPDYNESQPGYDNLDILINGLFPQHLVPEQTKELEPEMVFYQKTPARIVFELTEIFQFRTEDVFFDLGSGLGHVSILVNLLAGINVRGVEFEPAFCDYATYCAAELNLSDVMFINADARNADYSEGTVFFMYTPFKGEILRDVLNILQRESLKRQIKIITYGPCTIQVALQSWLNFEPPKTTDIYKLGVFSSL